MSPSFLTLALFVVVVVVRDDGAEGDVVDERVARIETSLFQAHFVVALALGVVAVVGEHSDVDESSRT